MFFNFDDVTGKVLTPLPKVANIFHTETIDMNVSDVTFPASHETTPRSETGQP